MKKHDSSYYRLEARKALQGKWSFAVGATALFFLATIIIQSFGNVTFLLPLILAPVLSYGYSVFFLRFSRGEECAVGVLFDGFSGRFLTIVFAYVMMMVRILLWSLLLIIPGVVAAFAYSQTWFILVDKKDIGALDAIEESKRMMMGHKWQLFLLSLSFIGWSLLTILTLFIGYLWLTPYIWVTFAKFYDSIKHGMSHKEEVVEVIPA